MRQKNAKQLAKKKRLAQSRIDSSMGLVYNYKSLVMFSKVAYDIDKQNK